MDDCLAAERKMCQLERKSQSLLSVDVSAYELQCAEYHALLYESQINYYSNIVSEHENDQKALFKVVNKLLHRNGPSPLPRHNSAKELTNTFADFFVEKILILALSKTNPTFIIRVQTCY